MSLGLTDVGIHDAAREEPLARAGALPLQPDPACLRVALALADEAMRGREPTRQARARLARLLYDGVAAGMPYALLLDFARRMAVDGLNSRAATARRRRHRAAGPCAGHPVPRSG